MSSGPASSRLKRRPLPAHDENQERYNPYSDVEEASSFAMEKEIQGSDDGNSIDMPTSSNALVPRRQGSGTAQYRNRGDLLKAKDQVWESLANKMLPPEESEFMATRLEEQNDARTKRTYVQGLPTSQVFEPAITISVGLTFMPGADKPQVTRFEQGSMTPGPPDQKNALWRVNTAGTLLRSFDVTPDLTVRATDRTSSIIESARGRKDRNSLANSASSSLQQITTRGGKEYDAVTIDSKRVTIVDNLRGGQYDIEATLIEVDGISLVSLMTNYRYLISREGPHMNFEENRSLLETMIEDARRLCVRSPILFRMSTRSRIVNSKNTRYGIDNFDYFRTITTSKGIKEIILISASYYDALDPEGSNDMNQKYIRPRFLQMLTLLLLFLNDDDLREISPFLEATYRIKAERSHIEILLLKVIPLVSINSKIFLEALVSTVEGFQLQEPASESRQAAFWDTFVQRILSLGYILPGGIEQLGRENDSWIVKWPEHGFKSSQIFKHLQYAGDRLRTINDIAPVDLHPEKSFTKLTVHMANDEDYILDSQDIESITLMNTGQYIVTDTGTSGRTIDLRIQEMQLNSYLEQAIAKINGVIDHLNKMLALPKKRFPLSRGRPTITKLLNNFEGSGRITKHIALLDQTWISTAFKVEGRKITKMDAFRKMTRDESNLDVLIRDLERRAEDFDYKNDNPRARAFTEIKGLLDLARDQRRQVGSEHDYPDEPISQVLFPNGQGPGMQGIWYDYRASYREKDRLLHLVAKMAPVTGVQWRQNNVVEVSLQGHASRYLAKPLAESGFDPDDEIQEGDRAALVGQYLLIAETIGQEGASLAATNYLKITGIEERPQTRRRANRTRQEDFMTDAVFH